MNGIFLNQGGNGLFALVDLLFHKFDHLPGLPLSEGIMIVFGMIAFLGQHMDQLPAALNHFSQLSLLN